LPLLDIVPPEHPGVCYVSDPTVFARYSLTTTGDSIQITGLSLDPTPPFRRPDTGSREESVRDDAEEAHRLLIQLREALQEHIMRLRKLAAVKLATSLKNRKISR
jgi:hypothetical protein